MINGAVMHFHRVCCSFSRPVKDLQAICSQMLSLHVKTAPSSLFSDLEFIKT